jgi:putative transposase
MQERFKSNNNVVYSCKYHVIWCPKYRKPLLVDKVAKRLKELIRQQAVRFESEVIELEVMPDHVHLLIEVDPQFGIRRLIKNIKGYTSKILRGEFKHLRTRVPTLFDKQLLCDHRRGSAFIFDQTVY